ncbi:MAG: hypothetical protein WKF28_05335 [Rubrobacteraceae bacterium]
MSKSVGLLVSVAATMLVASLFMLVSSVNPARAVSPEPNKVTNNTTHDHTPSYSPSGEKIAYRGVSSLSGRLSNDIFTINVDGTGRFNVTADTKNERDPSYSPDGEKIAYAGYDGQDWEIYTINADGGERIQITNNTTNELELSYSPDGEKIAYEGWDGQDFEIYTINADGGERIQITNNNANETDPSYSPSGKKIAYAGHDGQDFEIYTKYVGGGERIQITNNNINDTELSYSPDGRKIAYKRKEIAYVNSRYVTRDREIYTITLGPARRVVKVTHNGRTDEEPSYSPDGEKIAYQGNDGHDKEIYTINADGGG